MNEELKTKSNLLITELYQVYLSLGDILTEYIKGFNEDITFSFSFSEKQIKEAIKKYYLLSTEVTSLFDSANILTVKLAELLILAYETNEPLVLDKIDVAQKNQIIFEGNIKSFFDSCEKEVRKDKNSISITKLYKYAIELKQKNEFILANKKAIQN